jgi:hypothetical protein
MRYVWTLVIFVVFAATAAMTTAKAQTYGPVQSLAASQTAGATQSPDWRTSDPQSAFAHADTAPTSGSWRGLVWPSMSGGLVDRTGFANGDALQGPQGRPLIVGRFGPSAPFAQLAAGGGVGGDWPAMRFKTGAFGFDLTPHAGLGASGGADSQNAGALVRFGRGLGDDRQAGGRGRWFLFASADRETLGMGFMRNDDAWRRAGLGPDPGAVIGDTRAGLAWRDGPMEASVGYLYREIKPQDLDMLDAQSTRESLVAFRLAFHPGQR